MGHEHPFGKAVWYAIVLFAVTHLALSLFYGLLHGDHDIANMFHVLSFDLIWPALGKGPLNAVFGVVMIVGAWAIMGALLWKIYQGKDAETEIIKPAKKSKSEKSDE